MLVLPPRVEFFVYVTEVFVGDVGVDLGRGDVGVAEECLHGAEVGAVVEEVGREAVTEFVWGDFTGNTRDGCVPLDNALDTPRSEAQVFVVYRIGFGIFSILNEHCIIKIFPLLEIRSDCISRGVREKDDAHFVTLPTYRKFIPT